MSTCNSCGAEITFRWIDGAVRLPIHPDGGWHCGSWSDSGSSGVSTYSSVSHTREWPMQDFSHPWLTCPIKGCYPVYFIRHNGGSVWVDALGWPWPKHGCFDDPHSATSAFSALVSKGVRPYPSQARGRHLPAAIPQNGHDRFVEIKLHDSKNVPACFSTGCRPRILLLARWFVSQSKTNFCCTRLTGRSHFMATSKSPPQRVAKPVTVRQTPRCSAHAARHGSSPETETSTTRRTVRTRRLNRRPGPEPRFAFSVHFLAVTLRNPRSVLIDPQVRPHVPSRL